MTTMQWCGAWACLCLVTWGGELLALGHSAAQPITGSPRSPMELGGGETALLRLVILLSAVLSGQTALLWPSGSHVWFWLQESCVKATCYLLSLLLWSLVTTGPSLGGGAPP